MIKPFLKKKLQVNKQLVKGLVIYVAPNWPISPKLLTLTHFAKRERERNGTEGSRTPPRSCATPSRSETAAMACHVITRRRSSLQRGGRRKSPRCRQRFLMFSSDPLIGNFLSSFFAFFQLFDRELCFLCFLTRARIDILTLGQGLW